MSMESPFQHAQPPAEANAAADAQSPEGKERFAPNPEDIDKEAQRLWEPYFEEMSEDDPKYHSLEEVRDAVQSAVEEHGWPDDTKTFDSRLRTPIALAYQRKLYNVE